MTEGDWSTKLELTERSSTAILRKKRGIELSVLARQGLEHNIATVGELCEQVQSWQEYRNQHMATVHWQFTTADARTKLARLYPTIRGHSQEKAPSL